MNPKRISILACVLMLALSGLACQTLSSGQASPTAAVESRPTQPAAVVPAPTAAPSDAPTEASADASLLPAPISSMGAGIACLGFRDGGFSCLDEKGWRNFNTKNSDLPSDYLTAGALCPDGRVAIAHYDGISLFDGKKFEHIAKPKNYSTVDGLACGAEDDIWVAHFKGVSHYAKGAWKTYGSDLLATGESANELVYNVALAADGKLWAVTSRSVAVFENDKWTVFQKGQGFEDDIFFNALTLDASGRPWAAYSTGVAVYDNGTWKLVKKSGYDTPRAMSLDAKGQLWLGTLSKGVSVFNGSTWANYDKETESLSSNQVNVLTADSQGRVWLGTSYGLSVFDGSQWQTYRMDNSDLADNSIRFVVVAKDGPTLPAPADKEKASLTGKFEDAEHKPLAGKHVEICVEPLGTSFSGDTPCSDQPFFLSTETDDQGVFLIENVPTGYYVIVGETATGWAQLTDKFGIGSERTLIKPGEKHDIGTLTLQKK